MSKRFKVVVEDVYVDQAVVVVEALTRMAGQEWADELVEEGEGEPADYYRRFHVELVEESEVEDVEE